MKTTSKVKKQKGDMMLAHLRKAATCSTLKVK